MVSAIERAGDWRRCAGCACEFKVSIRGEGDAAAVGESPAACVRCGTAYRAKARHCHRCGATARGRPWRWGRTVLAPLVVTAGLAALGFMGVWHTAVAPVRPATAEMVTATPAIDVEARVQQAAYGDLRRKLDDAQRRADEAEARVRTLRDGIDRAIAITKGMTEPAGDAEH